MTVEQIGKNALAIRRYDRGGALRQQHTSERFRMDERHRAEREEMIARHQEEIANLDPMVLLGGIERIVREARADLDALVVYVNDKKKEVA